MEKGDKRAAVIQAALELVAEQGFHGAPIALIAERAGVAAGTIYRYFENKDVIIRETYAFVEEQIMAAVMAHYPEGRPIRERYLHFFQGLVYYFLAHPMPFRFVEQFHNSPYGIACRRDKMSGKKVNIITELFEEGYRQQIVKDLPLPVLYALTFGPMVDVCRDQILQFIQLDDALIARTAEACWDAIKR